MRPLIKYETSMSLTVRVKLVIKAYLDNSNFNNTFFRFLMLAFHRSNIRETYKNKNKIFFLSHFWPPTVQKMK